MWLTFLMVNLFCCKICEPFEMDYTQTRMFTTENNTYFGYSLLLQKGDPSVVIVGAPRKKIGMANSGSVYRCNLNNRKCEEFQPISRIKGTYPYGKNGDFLGSVLAGDFNTGEKFLTCAPRLIWEFGVGDYYITGRCFHIKNSNNTYENAKMFSPLSLENTVSIDKRIAYYNAAFGEVGFNVDFLKEKNLFIMGAPGKAQWNGALITTNILSYTTRFYSLSSDLFLNQDSYFGYSVAWGKFIANSEKIWFVAGGPRSDSLRGRVIFFDETTAAVKEQLIGEQFGSYFGSSLLVIHNNNKGRGDDILVGAPMFSGDFFDEGCVYYYRNNNNGNLMPTLKIRPRQRSARFGTTMVVVGDMDLDLYTDCAISAPNENDGEGAVYIYFGSESGFSNDNFYRISPSHFSAEYPNSVIRGFGVGLSNGNDVNNDKHNDIAIGAYKTSQVFVFITKPIFDVTLRVTTDTKILYTSTESFQVTPCISFRYRNEISLNLFLDTRLALEDDRILYRQNVTINSAVLKPNTVYCSTKTVYLKKNFLNIDALIISYSYRRNVAEDFKAKDTFILEIPVSYECGADNVCQTDLKIKSTAFEPTAVIVGANSELRVNITVDNSGESAYQVKLYMKVSPEISLINLRECDFENGSYVCLIASVLNRNQETEKSFLFDLGAVEKNWNWKSVPIQFKVESIGHDVNVSNNEINLNVPVILQTSPYIDSQAVPDSALLNNSETVLSLTHSFLVGNYGPSPLDLNLIMLVPQFKANGSDIFEIKTVEGTINNVDTSCSFTANTKFKKVGSNSKNFVPTQQKNDTSIISCIDSVENCSVIVCKGRYLTKSTQNSIFTVKVNVHIFALSQIMNNKNKLMFVSSAFYSNGTDEFYGTGTTLIFLLPRKEAIALWIYIVSVTLGFVLLSLLIFALYKCNFFRRNYKELMEMQSDEPRILEEEINENSEHDDANEGVF